MGRRNYYLEDVALDEARRRFAAALERAGGLRSSAPERVGLGQARGRVTAAPIWAKLSAPHYHAAAMDGIAVRAIDTVGATESSPLPLHLGTQARWVDTGDPLPADADAVIMAEHVQSLDDEQVEIRAAVAPWQHVRPLGEDLVATELVLPERHLLRPVDLGALAAAGHPDVLVYAHPRVAILPTGTELVTIEQAAHSLEPGQIIEFNSLVIAGLVEEWGGVATRFAPIPDQQEHLRAAISDALTDHDIVVINAGSSAGSEDYTAVTLREFGEVAVHGVAIRPGHPVILGVAQGKPCLGLPGYPVSTALTAELFLQPLLAALQGLPSPIRPSIEATISRKLLSPLGEDEFVRVTLGEVDGRMIATPLNRGAGVIMSLVRADGVAQIPRFAEGLHAGETVRVELLRSQAELERTLVTIGSHDLALDLLASHIRRLDPATRLSSANVGSLGGLLALQRGDAHLAGTHLLDEETGEYNWPFIRRILPNQEIVLVHVAYRDQGFIVPPGNPLGLHSLSDLTRPGIRFANRQRGSGTRVLLDYELKRAALAPNAIQGYGREEFTHMAVAAAVMSGSAQVGLGILGAARALGLDFVPLFRERYDLAVPRRHWESALLAPLRAALTDPSYQSAVHALGGYDVRAMGTLISP